MVFSVPQLTREEKRKNDLETKSSAINLMGRNMGKMKEAQAWIQRILTLQDHHIIENNHILYLGKREHDILTQLQNNLRVSISEIISVEKVILEIKGAQANLIEVVMNIERMLCEVQEEMARKKELALWSLSGEYLSIKVKSQLSQLFLLMGMSVPVRMWVRDSLEERAHHAGSVLTHKVLQLFSGSLSTSRVD